MNYHHIKIIIYRFNLMVSPLANINNNNSYTFRISELVDQIKLQHMEAGQQMGRDLRIHVSLKMGRMFSLLHNIYCKTQSRDDVQNDSYC
jgi:hypothetical protein